MRREPPETTRVASEAKITKKSRGGVDGDRPVCTSAARKTGDTGKHPLDGAEEAMDGRKGQKSKQRTSQAPPIWRAQPRNVAQFQIIIAIRIGDRQSHRLRVKGQILGCWTSSVRGTLFAAATVMIFRDCSPSKSHSAHQTGAKRFALAGQSSSFDVKADNASPST
jgi:hypothetical protein